MSNTGYLITGDKLEFLIELLNSKFIEFCFKQFYSISLGEKGIRWLSQYIMNLPIITSLNKTILFDDNLSNEDKNQIIYDLYSLSEIEKKYVENQ